MESNHRNGDFQSPALPTELQKRVFLIPKFYTYKWTFVLQLYIYSNNSANKKTSLSRKPVG